jgi:hypothetical protein
MTEKTAMLIKINNLDEKLIHMLSIQKYPTDKTGLGYVPPTSDTLSTSQTIFVKPAIPESPP